MKWVKLKKYCELSGDTANAVHTRRHRGIWPDGLQSRLGPDGKLWINLNAVDNWIEKNTVMDNNTPWR